jgi:hypothetical protein
MGRRGGGYMYVSPSDKLPVTIVKAGNNMPNQSWTKVNIDRLQECVDKSPVDSNITMRSVLAMLLCVCPPQVFNSACKDALEDILADEAKKQ